MSGVSCQPELPVIQPTLEGYVDLCVNCSSAVKTFANLQVARDEKYLVPLWMPPGGCTCLSLQVDPSCRLCFPDELRCQHCGDAS